MILELNLNPETSAAVTEMAAAGPARMKVLDPLATMGPSTPAEILSFSHSLLRLRVSRRVLVGSKVQVRARDRIAFGKVLSVTENDGAVEIVVDVR